MDRINIWIKLVEHPSGCSAIASVSLNPCHTKVRDNSTYLDEIANYIHRKHNIYGKQPKEHPDDAATARHLIVNGSPEQRDKMAGTTLIRNNSLLASTLALKGTDKQRYILLDHPDKYVRIEVARYRNNSHRDKLINDDENVRAIIAERGNNSHRDMLMKDTHWFVRHNVAMYGDKSHRVL